MSGNRCPHKTILDADNTDGHVPFMILKRCQLDDRHDGDHEFVSAWDTAGTRLRATWASFQRATGTIERKTP